MHLTTSPVPHRPSQMAGTILVICTSFIGTPTLHNSKARPPLLQVRFCSDKVSIYIDEQGGRESYTRFVESKLRYYCNLAFATRPTSKLISLISTAFFRDHTCNTCLLENPASWIRIHRTITHLKSTWHFKAIRCTTPISTDKVPRSFAMHTIYVYWHNPAEDMKWFTGRSVYTAAKYSKTPPRIRGDPLDWGLMFYRNNFWGTHTVLLVEMLQ